MIQLEGRNPVHEAMKQGTVTLLKLERGHEQDPKMKQILDMARKKDIKVQLVNRKQIEKLSTTGRHQGVIGYAQTSPHWGLGKVLEETGRDLCVLILDEVQDPHNLGAIIRTSEGAGVDGIAIPKRGSAKVSETVHRVSMGGSLYVPVWQTNLYPAIKKLRDDGVTLIAIDPTGNKPYYEEDLTGAIALVLGGENRGINPTLLGKCEKVVNIPMMGNLESLNVSVATAIVLYERVRQMEQRK